VERVASAGVLGESRPDGILANTAASAVCITSDLPVIRSELVSKTRCCSHCCWQVQSVLDFPALLAIMSATSDIAN
jgi:hypothetical protein